ncbi:MAG: hypothetical protein ABDH28_07360 [Brevinematia bacterium]
MKNFTKTIFSIFAILLAILSIVGISAFSSFYNDLSHTNLDKYFLQDISILVLTIFILTLLPLTTFLIRTKLAILKYSQKAELSKLHSRTLITLDLLTTLLILFLILTNLREIHLCLTLPAYPSALANIYDYPFFLKVAKFLILYLIIILTYLIAPILYLSHKSYSVRFLYLTIVPHKVSLTLTLAIFLFLLLLAFSVFLYSFILSIELYPKYSLILTFGIIVSLILLLYSLVVLVKLINNSTISWILNLIAIAFSIGFISLTCFSKTLPDVSLIRFELIDKINKNILSSKFCLRVNNIDASSTFDKIDIGKLERLKELEITEHMLSENRKPVDISILRKAKFLERIYILLRYGVVDLAFKKNLVVTNQVNIETLSKWFFPKAFYYFSTLSNTNYFDISFPYEFGSGTFLYKRYLVYWTSDKDVKVLDTRGKDYENRNTLTAKDYYVITRKTKFISTTHRILLVKSTNTAYHMLATTGASMLISNETYTVFFVKEYKQDEMFLFLEGVPLFLSNIVFDSKVVGLKVRYFDIDGRGGNLQEGISNLVGNAVYYYKVVDLTNRIEKLREYIEENKEQIPPDVLERLRYFISK